MTFSSLVRRNLLHYWQTNLAVVAGVAVAVAVLAGALLVGSSVRASLRSLALERLGSVDSVVTSAHFLDDAFATTLSEAGAIDDLFGGVVPLIAVEGFVTHQESGRRASGIQVYGIDDRFWAFQGVDPEVYPLGRRVFLRRRQTALLDQALVLGHAVVALHCHDDVAFYDLVGLALEFITDRPGELFFRDDARQTGSGACALGANIAQFEAVFDFPGRG